MLCVLLLQFQINIELHLIANLNIFSYYCELLKRFLQNAVRLTCLPRVRTFPTVASASSYFVSDSTRITNRDVNESRRANRSES